MGFAILTALFCIIGFAFDSLTSGSLLALYVVAQFFFNFGPNTTTFIIPGECFPTRYRSTGHGLSAACGKVGAIIAQVMAQPLLAKGAKPNCKGIACQPWLNHLMQIFALFMFLGTLVSFLVPETKGRTLEELAGEHDGRIQEMAREGRGFRGWMARSNPFTGGKPAGFSTMRSPNMIPRSPGMRGRKERVGIMTSPELLPKPGEKRKKGQRHVPSPSFESGQHSGSVGSEGRGLSRDGDDVFTTIGTRGMPPGWSAGWGVQRNPTRDGRVESIMLHDVGSLLK